jgi:hypothetical protein
MNKEKEKCLPGLVFILVLLGGYITSGRIAITRSTFFKGLLALPPPSFFANGILRCFAGIMGGFFLPFALR